MTKTKPITPIETRTEAKIEFSLVSEAAMRCLVKPPLKREDIPYPNPLDTAVNVGDLAYMEQMNKEYLDEFELCKLT